MKTDTKAAEETGVQQGAGFVHRIVRGFFEKSATTFWKIEAREWRKLYQAQRGGDAYNEMQLELAETRAACRKWKRIADGFAPFVEPHIWEESSVQDTMEEYEAIISANVRNDLRIIGGNNSRPRMEQSGDGRIIFGV